MIHFTFPPLALSFAALWVTTASALFTNGSITAPCESPLYCQGAILEAIELAQPFVDSKTFVDMPTIRPLSDVISAFNQLELPLTNSSALQSFLSTNFAPAGGELEAVPPSQLTTNATFLTSVTDTVIREFTQAVVGIWPDLTRRYKGAGNCTECEDSFIPVNRTFVVAGGRFREPYYWDSYWIVEGLLRTGGAFIEITKNTLLNFLDLVERFGFVPNGARVYYLVGSANLICKQSGMLTRSATLGQNRSQPPLLSQMVRIYVERTNDTSVLSRAIPLLIKEHEFWMTNRTVNVTAADGKSYLLNRYNVNNNQPRPESYREDWITANNRSFYAASGIIYPVKTPLNESEMATLYRDLASGAESGWDYGTRWIARPADAVRDVYFPLRSLNTHNIVPVCLNSILYWNEVTIADFLAATGNASAATEWRGLAKKRSDAMYALMWNSTVFSYFDYNLTSKSQRIYVPNDDDDDARGTCSRDRSKVLFSVAQFYPFWTGAAPAQLKGNSTLVLKAFARVADQLKNTVGGIPATNVRTGQQWDSPNVWPPLMHVLMQGLLNTPRKNGGTDDKAVRDLALKLGQRYVDSAFCTWYATGGSTSLTPKLQGLGVDAKGTMFEKYDANSTNHAGGGGEYTVVEGFGWTNGVLLWTVDTFAKELKRPDCGNITAANVRPGKRSFAVNVHEWDARWIKKF
ncbi:glycoside hydrolase family 37 protein [Gonapodya prolifera JEL478]|uniref:Trehalase n=1 Tax=Gonapodya prolifera (strain JEL478) TaxID=1344416 RepID=A0A139A977_GONPJ|nr:glycoside hydrolase family 37 protein [Gonapodya prolifera JEL478]|eukprot:KXS13025.1 glycoside hydrolase family 37 protein [Gonapodya prolifera JEL478]